MCVDDWRAIFCEALPHPRQAKPSNSRNEGKNALLDEVAGTIC